MSWFFLGGSIIGLPYFIFTIPAVIWGCTREGRVKAFVIVCVPIILYIILEFVVKHRQSFVVPFSEMLLGALVSLLVVLYGRLFKETRTSCIALAATASLVAVLVYVLFPRLGLGITTAG